jgi:hypothetical protein
VCPFHLHQPQRVALDPDVDGGPEPDVGHPEQVRPAAVPDERGCPGRRAVDEQGVGRRERGAAGGGIQRVPEVDVG